MNDPSDHNQILDRAAQRRKTALSIKNKGGVGGSHIAIATATVLRMSGANAFTTAIVDLDGSTGTTISRMGERDADGSISAEQSLAAGVPAIDLFDPGVRGSLFDLTETEDRFLILDGPAASLNMFENLTENLDAGTWVAHNAACNRDLIVIVPITPHLASIVAVGQAIDTFGPDAHYVVVRSMRGCTAADYVLWDALDFRDKFGRVVSGRSKSRLEDVGGTVLDMPTLNAAVLARVEALQLPFHEAVSSSMLGAAERLSVKRWLEAWTRQLDAIRGPLGLSADFAWRVA